MRCCGLAGVFAACVLVAAVASAPVGEPVKEALAPAVAAPTDVEVAQISERIFEDERERAEFEVRKHDMNLIVAQSLRYEDRVAQCSGPCGEGLKLFTVWTTSAAGWNSKYTHSIDSALYHHPKAEVSIYSSSLPSTFLADFAALGYNVSVHRLDLANRAKGTPLESWASQLDQWYSGPFYYAHLSDAARMLVLYKEGGIYFDTDVVFVNAMDRVKNSIGWERQDSLCNALMSFEAENEFLKASLREFSDTYVMDDWAANGPALLTRVYDRDFQHSTEVHALSKSAFYLISWDDVQGFFAKESDADKKRDMHVVTSGTYVVHFWNSRSHDLVVHPDSFMALLFKTFCVFCNPLHTQTAETVPPNVLESANNAAQQFYVTSTY